MGRYMKCQTGNNSLKSTLGILKHEIVLYTQNAAYFVFIIHPKHFMIIIYSKNRLYIYNQKDKIEDKFNISVR